MRLSWTVIASGLVVVAVLGASWALARRAEAGPEPPVAPASPPPVGRAGEALQLAGSGSNLPLTRRLAAAFEAETGE
ncbi:MAG TPA: hypothetical protein RMH80_25925, partial [Polyangiaceae bacterium LLY-WYZ-15_(1-7)]|nr:hypothetical protein [Polyangiaceae bacterium LLY-WYZ-15_(1-7)]